MNEDTTNILSGEVTEKMGDKEIPPTVNEELADIELTPYLDTSLPMVEDPVDTSSV